MDVIERIEERTEPLRERIEGLAYRLEQVSTVSPPPEWFQSAVEEVNRLREIVSLLQKRYDTPGSLEERIYLRFVSQSAKREELEDDEEIEWWAMESLRWARVFRKVMDAEFRKELV